LLLSSLFLFFFKRDDYQILDDILGSKIRALSVLSARSLPVFKFYKSVVPEILKNSFILAASMKTLTLVRPILLKAASAITKVPKVTGVPIVTGF
jgi:hypothetical protein